MKYKVEITETLQRQVEVDAQNEDEAYDKVNELYKEGEIVLDSNDYVDKEINIISGGHN